MVKKLKTNYKIFENSLDELDFDSLVKIDLNKLKERWNPFESVLRVKLDRPITKEEITECIENKQFISPEVPVKMVFNFWDVSTREEHLKRIAWLVENYDEKYPISIDFGIPKMNCPFELSDGNHRLAAAIYLDKLYITAIVGGSVDEIKKYLYNG